MRGQFFCPRIWKTNSKLILIQYDKNLLQNNSSSRDCEIPIDGYLGQTL
jgi:hypothetical protein